MLALNPKAILQLSKLSRTVLHVKGVRYGIGEEKGILELLKYVQANRDPAYDEIYQSFLLALTPDEQIGLRLKSIAKPTAAVVDDEQSAASEPKMRTVYYRGVKKQIIDDSGGE